VTRVVCALSGGGAKTAAHLGALRALADHDMTPAHYVATSMGALVAAAFAAGARPDGLFETLGSLSRGDIASPAAGMLLGVFGESLFRPGPLRGLIRRLVPVQRFDELGVPLTVTAVDLESGELVLFGAGGRIDVSLEDALYATCALPLYFPPAALDGHLYVDGGLRSVLPLDEAARFEPDVLFAVDVGPSWRETPPDHPLRVPPLVRRSGQVQRVMMAAQTENAVARWRARPAGSRPELVLVEPAVRAETTFRLDLVGLYADEGYRAASAVLSARRVP
jgi:NTE family protein